MIHTIGHGNRPLEEFIGLLERFRIGCLVDVRAFPGSRRHPHFGRRVLERAAASPVAIMCAERLPWQCHRYMISDYLVARGIEVLHIMDAGAGKEHALRAEARIAENRLVYDANTQAGLGLD